MQPRPGFCGMATLNSTLRSFGGILAGGTAPYLKLHAYPRYVMLEEMVKLLNDPRTIRVKAHQCMLGLLTKGPDGQWIAAKKPTGFLTNSPRVAEAPSARCTGVGGACSRNMGGRHALCSNQHGKDAAKYPRGLCRAMLRGIAEQGRDDSLLKDGCFGMQVGDDDADVEAATRGPAQGYSGKYKGDLTSQAINDAMVVEARAKELTFFYSKGVRVKEASPHGPGEDRTSAYLSSVG